MAVTYYIVKVRYPVLIEPRYLGKDGRGWHTTDLEKCLEFSSKELAEESRDAFLLLLARDGLPDVRAEVIDGGNAPFNPDWVTIPGHHIKGALEEASMTAETFADRMGLSMDVVTPLLQGALTIDDGMAEKLSTVVGGPKQFWLNLESIYRDGLARGLHVSGRDD